MSSTAKIKITILLVFIVGIGFYFVTGIDRDYTQNPDASVNDTLPPPGKPSLAPGTAKVKAQIIELDSTTAGRYLLNLKIQEILGYGAATPPLATGDSLRVRASTFLSSTQSDIKIKSGETLTVLIQHTQTMHMDNKKGLTWSLVEIERY